MSYLQNPKKEASCNYPIAKVKEVIKTLQDYTKNATLIFDSDVMGTYKFECKGQNLLSLGMILDVTLHETDATHTLIQLECRRKVGAIDKPIELNECVEFMIGAYSLIGKVLLGTATKP